MADNFSELVKHMNLQTQEIQGLWNRINVKEIHT